MSLLVKKKEMLIYTRLVLLFIALGLIGSGVAAIVNLFSGKDAVTALLTLLLVVGISYFWIKDWKQIGKCAALEK